VSTQDISRRYDRWSALYDFADGLGPLGRSERGWRRRVAARFDDVQGWVLDAACGTGVMVEYFNGFKGRLIAVDASLKMVRRAGSRSRSAGARPLVVLGDVNRLPLKDGVLGGIVCTFSLTTVRDPEQALREFERTLIPASRLVILDSERPDGFLTGLVYPALVPISRFFCHTHIDRDIAGLLSGVDGLEITDEERFLGGMVSIFESKKTQPNGSQGANNSI
jgi:ubiquinone/menaquinone biosynthesis C-methylase UbiE